MAEGVKLLGTWASPFSRRIEIALKLKGIQYEYSEENLSDKSPLLLKYNPVHKKVPVFLHNGKPVAESLVILEYIDETWKDHPILPKHPYDRAIARFWAKFVDEKILQTLYKARSAKDEELPKIIEEAGEQMKILENELEGKEFFGGETIGYLDIVAFSVAYWFQVHLEVLGVKFLTEEKFPVVCKWIGRLLDIEVVKSCVPPRDKYLAHIKTRIEATTDAAAQCMPL
ncbi:hypothetical protein K2173_015607 [Erythroxylum novogranatense]|uniref:glutathione transferase n=1 Tax=Erythroxylum novogranatense TaxID=1862640 RepID=A0AAV8SE75_9ROSI|nr:hypothetical protein K2173_015607 [Erythroxylum novogranatense]